MKRNVADIGGIPTNAMRSPLIPEQVSTAAEPGTSTEALLVFDIGRPHSTTVSEAVRVKRVRLREIYRFELVLVVWGQLPWTASGAWMMT